MTGSHPEYWTARLRCTHETRTQGKPRTGAWISCRPCQNQQLIVDVSPVLAAAPGPAGWVQEPLPLVAAPLEAA